MRRRDFDQLRSREEGNEGEVLSQILQVHELADQAGADEEDAEASEREQAAGEERAVEGKPECAHEMSVRSRLVGDARVERGRAVVRGERGDVVQVQRLASAALQQRVHP